MITDDDDQAPQKLSERRVQSTLRKIAHELRTPIGVISSSADLLQSEAFGPLGDERYLEYAKSIGRSADFALNIIAQSIDDPGLKAHAVDYVLQDIDANAVIANSVEQLKPFADNAAVSLEADLFPGNLMVHSDAVMLQQIINNAGTNAIKFSPIGARIVISSNLLEHGRAVIAVADNGIGMSSAELARIRSKGSAPGLGYRVIHQLCERSGAEIVVNSKRGEGTVVEIQLDAAGVES